MQNRYPGVNPHLNSRLQQPGGYWRSFHTVHIGHIFEELDRILPDAYYVAPERSLQIGVYDAAIHTVADLLVSRRDEPMRSGPAPEVGASPTITLPIPQLVDDEDELDGLVIYKSDGATPVTRIELLSPANKPGGSHYGSYRVKRLETLHAGLRLVEIDYLHQRPPIIIDVSDYPYYFVVSDPRDGEMRVFGVGVMDPLPMLSVPLDGTDSVVLDFDKLYNQTFSKRVFWQSVDYGEEPDGYSESDLALIRARMRELAYSGS